MISHFAHLALARERNADVLCVASPLFFGEAAVRTAAERCTCVPSSVRYTWGKLAILDLRERARAAWDEDLSVQRFHSALLALGSPALGLMETVLERG
jgi:uncharacterized protein (DUF885 family)